MANQYTKQREIQRKEIIWNIINSALAGGLVFFGGLVNGKITETGIIAAAVAAAIVALTKFKDFWSSEEKEYTKKIFSFIR